MKIAIVTLLYMACLVRPTVENPNILNLYWYESKTEILTFESVQLMFISFAWKITQMIITNQNCARSIFSQLTYWLMTAVQLHSVSSSSHVACLSLVTLCHLSSLVACVSLSSTTCCQGSLSPISHCLRPTGPTSAFVSQHHGVLHLQHRAIHHRSR